MFVRSCLTSGLVTQEQLDEAARAVRSEDGLAALPAVEVGEELLAKKLVAQKVLTQYQAEQLKSGRTKLSLGPYVITDWLGQGGMGQVFVAMHSIMHREVAIKVLPKSRSTPDAIASFAREIKTQAKLDHRNLVRAYDAGHDGNVYFLVTEYVPGADLRKMIRAQGPLSMAHAAHVIRQAAKALAYAHRQGLVHRDVKPGNILVTPDGIVKVSDLGLAGYWDDTENDPRAGKIVGTADYLSPEKILAPHTVSPVSDIYSLGCTLYYAVTGKVPFPGGTTRDKARRHCEETPWHPRQFNPEVSDEFVDLIADMMEKDPRRRVQSADDVVERLATWASPQSPLPQPMSGESRWIAPSIPTNEDTVDDLGEVELSTDQSDGQDSSNALSQGSFPGPPVERISKDVPVTASTPPPPPVTTPSPVAIYGPEQTRRALMLAIPLAASCGAFLMWLIMKYVAN
ncbi:MAG: serine/threonine protein kinase [Planctomycetales bacterium]|nr:serine/threonine protein kinase [Planctomycetales bacterium]